MRAVNLIPIDERRRSGATGSGLGSYVLLAVLALIVAVGASYTLTNKTISDRRAELADVQARAQASADEAQRFAGYTAFTALRQKRTETVRSLATSRFDWSHALHEVARTIPANAWLSSMRATVTPTASADGGTTDPLRASINAPAIELVGCTTSQDNVANVIASLRRIDGVQRVSLSSSEKIARSTSQSDGAGGDSAGSTSGSGSDCRNGNFHFPQFSMTVFFETPSATGAPTGAKGTTP